MWLPETWFVLEGWSISWRKCQSSHNPLAFIAALSSRFKFTSPRIRPGKDAQKKKKDHNIRTTPDTLYLRVCVWIFIKNRFTQTTIKQLCVCLNVSQAQACRDKKKKNDRANKTNHQQQFEFVMVGVPVTELEAGLACRAMSGWEELWLWRTCICWALDIPCRPLSTWLGEASKGCWEGAEAAGRCGGLIFSAISCSLILLIKTRLSSWQQGNDICDKRTAIISSVSVSLWRNGSL